MAIYNEGTWKADFTEIHKYYKTTYCVLVWTSLHSIFLPKIAKGARLTWLLIPFSVWSLNKERKSNTVTYQVKGRKIKYSNYKTNSWIVACYVYFFSLWPRCTYIHLCRYCYLLWSISINLSINHLSIIYEWPDTFFFELVTSVSATFPLHCVYTHTSVCTSKIISSKTY